MYACVSVGVYVEMVVVIDLESRTNQWLNVNEIHSISMKGRFF